MTSSLTTAKIAEITEGQLVGDPAIIISGVADLETATNNEASFFDVPLHGGSRYEKAMKQSQAGVIFVTPEAVQDDDRTYITAGKPSKAFQKLVEFFYTTRKMSSGFGPGIHSSAVVHPEATLGNNVTVLPQAVIDTGVVIGDDTTIEAGCYIGPNVVIGKNCHLHARVVVRENCILGNNVIIQPGAVIGSCGFGYLTDERGQHTKLTQLGNVYIEDDVEIGANTTIDRARFQTTRIGQGTKIDNLVQIAHGVTIGRHCFVVSQTGIAGSAAIGNHVVLAGQSAVVGHLKVVDGTILAARGAITKTITKPGPYGGAPAVPMKNYHRQEAHIRKLDSYVVKIKNLEERIKKLEQ